MHQSAPTQTPSVLPSGTRWGAAHIAVTDRAKALAVWRDVVGLELLRENNAELVLGIGSTEMVVLELGATAPATPRAPGLYHVAIHVPTRADFADFAHRCIISGTRMAPTDHLVSEAIYIWDHDKNGIELTFETPWRGIIAEPGSGNYVLTKDGTPHSGREPIDLEALLAEISNPIPPATLPKGTRLGHIHVHVDNLDTAMQFYCDVIGFGGVMMMPDWGMGDAGLGYMPHAIAFNVWAKPSKPQPNEAGLRHLTLIVPDAAAYAGVLSRLEAAGAQIFSKPYGVETYDPTGNCIRLVAA